MSDTDVMEHSVRIVRERFCTILYTKDYTYLQEYFAMETERLEKLRMKTQGFGKVRRGHHLDGLGVLEVLVFKCYLP